MTVVDCRETIVYDGVREGTNVLPRVGNHKIADATSPRDKCALGRANTTDTRFGCALLVSTLTLRMCLYIDIYVCRLYSIHFLHR